MRITYIVFDYWFIILFSIKKRAMNPFAKIAKLTFLTRDNLLEEYKYAGIFIGLKNTGLKTRVLGWSKNALYKVKLL